MTRKHVHTHRGHCQLCGAVQALHTGKGIVAKHGYTIEGGYFQGVCPGSDQMNLHVTRELADAEIVRARRAAFKAIKLAQDFEDGKQHPAEVWNGTYRMIPVRKRRSEASRSPYPDRAPWSELEKEEVDVPFAKASAKYRKLGIERAANKERRYAEMCRNYADRLESTADRITGKVEPFLAADLKLRGFGVGDVVRIDGAKGYNLVIQAIEDRVYKSFGWSGRSSEGTLCPHAKLTRPAVPEKRDRSGYTTAARPACTWWEPVRFLKRPKEGQT